MKFIDNVQVEKIGQTFWLKSGDQTWSYDIIELSLEGQRRKKSNAASPDKIVAPMPGKLTKVHVKEGDSVTVGQPLLVMEAMKMEYTLKSDLETVVEKVLVQTGDQVQVGAVLVKLKSDT